MGSRVARAVPLSGSLLVLVCVFLPQTEDCHGVVHTPIHDEWGPILVGLAVIGALPALWRFRTVRTIAPPVVTLVAIAALGQVVLGIPIAVVLASRLVGLPPEEREHLTAAAAAAFVLVFVLAFPVLSTLVNRHWLTGAYLTWVGAWIELAGLAWWLREARSPPRQPLPVAEIFE